MISKIKSSTILETIVSLIIIISVFSISTMIIVQTTQSSSSFLVLKAGLWLEDYRIKTTTEKAWYDEDITLNGWFLQRRVSDYQEDSTLKRIQYKLYDNNERLLSSFQEIVLTR